MYNTHYTHCNGELISITFGLGETVSVNANIELPTLTAQKRILYLDKNKASSKTMQLWFPFLFIGRLSSLNNRFIFFQLIRPCQNKVADT